MIVFIFILGAVVMAHSHSLCEEKRVKFNHQAYSPEDDYFTSSIEYCDCNATRMCLRKCCQINYIIEGHTCVSNISIDFKVDVYNGTRVLNETIEFKYISGMVTCNEGSFYKLDPKNYPEDTFYLQKDGRLWQPELKTHIKQEDYCLEYFADIELSALVCSPNTQRFGRKINAVGMIISMPFLLATFCVYALLPERNLHGKSLMCYVLSLFLAYLLLVIIQTHFEIVGAGCKALGIFCFFFFMISFFWMNIMSIDMWWTFSGVKVFFGNKKETQRKRFLLYNGYAWGLPFLLTLFVTCLNRIIQNEGWYNPGIGDGQCWFNNGFPTLLYFYGPLAAIITVNVVLFIKTALKIKEMERDTQMLRMDETSKQAHERDKQRFYLYLKLLLAMGVNWSMEIISWFIDWQAGELPPAIWYLTDFCNALYGVFIFFIFVVKRTIWNLLKRRCLGITWFWGSCTWQGTFEELQNRVQQILLRYVDDDDSLRSS